MDGRIRILVADRSLLVVEALEDIFMELNGGAGVLGATSLQEAIRIVLQEQPELILLDPWIGMGDADDAIRQLLACSPSSSVYVMATHCDTDFVQRMRRAGAIGCCEKESLPSNARSIIDGVRSA